MGLTVYEDILNLEREIGSLFQGLPGGSVSGRFLRSGLQYPSVNVFDTNEDFVVLAELPGVRKEEVHLTLDNGLLTISGERKDGTMPEKAEWLRREIGTGSFSRVIELPRHVDGDRISAELSDGILRVVFPKAEEAKPREVKIK